jgi:hypothetical protein
LLTPDDEPFSHRSCPESGGSYRLSALLAPLTQTSTVSARQFTHAEAIMFNRLSPDSRQRLTIITAIVTLVAVVAAIFFVLFNPSTSTPHHVKRGVAAVLPAPDLTYSSYLLSLLEHQTAVAYPAVAVHDPLTPFTTTTDFFGAYAAASQAGGIYQQAIDGQVGLPPATPYQNRASAVVGAQVAAKLALTRQISGANPNFCARCLFPAENGVDFNGNSSLQVDDQIQENTLANESHGLAPLSLAVFPPSTAKALTVASYDVHQAGVKLALPATLGDPAPFGPTALLLYGWASGVQLLTQQPNQGVATTLQADCMAGAGLATINNLKPYPVVPAFLENYPAATIGQLYRAAISSTPQPSSVLNARTKLFGVGYQTGAGACSLPAVTTAAGSRLLAQLSKVKPAAVGSVVTPTVPPTPKPRRK